MCHMTVYLQRTVTFWGMGRPKAQWSSTGWWLNTLKCNHGRGWTLSLFKYYIAILPKWQCTFSAYFIWDGEGSFSHQKIDRDVSLRERFVYILVVAAPAIQTVLRPWKQLGSSVAIKLNDNHIVTPKSFLFWGEKKSISFSGNAKLSVMGAQTIRSRCCIWSEWN